VTSARLAAALLALAATTAGATAATARQEEEEPAKPKVAAPTAKAPEPFVVDRSNSAVEFPLTFQLGDAEKSRLRVHFDGAAGSAWQDERCLLALDFEPLEGARFSWSRVAPDRSLEKERHGGTLESVALAAVAEPKDLAFELKVRFPPRRGIEVTLADGTPLLVARTPSAPSLAVSIEVVGNVTSVSAGAPKATSDPRLVELLKRTAPTEPLPDLGPSAAPPVAWQLATLTESGLPVVPPAQPVDEVDAPEGTVERVALSVGELMIVPALVVKPRSEAKAPSAPRHACVVVGGAPHGKSEPAVLAEVAKHAKQGELVVAVDLLGSGERRELQPYDSLESPEPRLVGKLAEQYAADELRQVVAWTRRRPDVDSEHVELDLDVPSMEAMRRAGALLGEAIPDSAASEKPSAELVGASILGPENVRSRFDSWLLDQTFEASDAIVVERSKALAERLQPVLLAPSSGSRLIPNQEPLAFGEGKLTLCASDFGPAAALDFALGQGLAEKGGAFMAVDDAPGRSDPSNGADRDTWLFLRASRLEARLRGSAGERVRLFGEGSCGVVMLLVAALHPEQVESVTALHSIPSFETLLRRPGDVRRAPASLEVLSQGMPSELFVRDALRRFDLEECVLALKAKGVAVDWRDPVGALRRPLPRHDRLAMWPRVRHAELEAHR
jgi:hypothetical protein